MASSATAEEEELAAIDRSAVGYTQSLGGGGPSATNAVDRASSEQGSEASETKKLVLDKGRSQRRGSSFLPGMAAMAGMPSYHFGAGSVQAGPGAWGGPSLRSPYFNGGVAQSPSTKQDRHNVDEDELLLNLPSSTVKSTTSENISSPGGGGEENDVDHDDDSSLSIEIPMITTNSDDDDNDQHYHDSKMREATKGGKGHDGPLTSPIKGARGVERNDANKHVHKNNITSTRPRMTTKPISKRGSGVMMVNKSSPDDGQSDNIKDNKDFRVAAALHPRSINDDGMNLDTDLIIIKGDNNGMIHSPYSTKSSNTNHNSSTNNNNDNIASMKKSSKTFSSTMAKKPFSPGSLHIPSYKPKNNSKKSVITSATTTSVTTSPIRNQHNVHNKLQGQLGREAARLAQADDTAPFVTMPEHRPLVGGFAAAAYEAAREYHYRTQAAESLKEQQEEEEKQRRALRDYQRQHHAPPSI